MADTVMLKVNGVEIRLNAFVQKALLGVLEGFLTALDGVPVPAGDIELTVKR